MLIPKKYLRGEEYHEADKYACSTKAKLNSKGLPNRRPNDNEDQQKYKNDIHNDESHRSFENDLQLLFDLVINGKQSHHNSYEIESHVRVEGSKVELSVFIDGYINSCN